MAAKINPQDYNDECPTHGGEITREYTFGVNDCTVVKHACGCCIVWPEDGLADGTLYRSYRDAEGLARLIVAHSQCQDAYFSKQ